MEYYELLQLMLEEDDNQDKLAKELGVSQATISRWANNTQIPGGVSILKIRNAAAKRGIAHGNPVAEENHSGDIANLDLQAGMGAGGLLSVTADGDGQVAPEYITGHWSFPDEVLARWMHQSKTYAFRVDGDSMEPTLIGGSYVFVDTTQQYPNPPDIYVIDYGDGLMVKRCELVPKSDKILIISDNDRYNDRELLRDEVRIWGRVVALFQWRG